MKSEYGEETQNVLISTLAISAVIIALSVLALWYITGDGYLSADYALEVFFALPTSVAGPTINAMAASYGTAAFASVIFIEIVDNLSRLLIISFVVAAVIDLVAYASVENMITKFKVGMYSDHVIVCGYNEIADDLIQRLRASRIRFVVIEKDRSVFAEIRGLFPTILGNFTSEDTLRIAAAEKAYAAVFVASADMENMFGALSAKHLNKDLKLLARAGHEETRVKMLRAGVDMCVLPERLAGVELGDALLGLVK